ncbi:hypothetical protein FQR65_LT09403 [Abscondita terminalis]|nr:hypothetical protein FQR65_LT09403 [Abscondita terminalis]
MYHNGLSLTTLSSQRSTDLSSIVILKCDLGNRNMTDFFIRLALNETSCPIQNCSANISNIVEAAELHKFNASVLANSSKLLNVSSVNLYNAIKNCNMTVNSTLYYLNIFENPNRFFAEFSFGTDYTRLMVLSTGNYSLSNIQLALKNTSLLITDVISCLPLSKVAKNIGKVNSTELTRFVQNLDINSHNVKILFSALNVSSSTFLNHTTFVNLRSNLTDYLNQDGALGVFISKTQVVTSKKAIPLQKNNIQFVLNYTHIFLQSQEAKLRYTISNISVGSDTFGNEFAVIDTKMTLLGKPSKIGLVSNETKILNCTYITKLHNDTLITENFHNASVLNKTHFRIVKSNTTMYTLGSPFYCQNRIFGLAILNNTQYIDFFKFNSSNITVEPIPKPSGPGKPHPSSVILTLTINKEVGFKIHIIHLNDFHARFEETSRDSGTCKDDNCIGGFSRIYTAVNQQLKKHPNALVLNAGDNFQGTIWYNIYKWNVTQHFLNKIPFDAYTLGNHEFDDNIEGVVPFIKALKAPTVAVNIDDSQEPDFQGIYKKSVVIVREGRRIGVVGVLLSTTDNISNSGKLKFLDESETVNKEAKRLVEEEHVHTVIVLSHCGYEIDKEIAKNATSKISIVVGAHSHSFLYTGSNPPNGKVPVGPYPTIVSTNDGRKVLVVQASAYTEFLGDISVSLDKDGNTLSWVGAPIYMDKAIPLDNAINKELDVWKAGLVELGDRVIGSTKVLLEHVTCRVIECNLGNLIADSMVYDFIDSKESNAWAYATIAILNPGGIRASLPVGNITYKDLLTAMPFENTVDTGEIRGKYIKEFLEKAAEPFNNQRIRSTFNMLQVSGIHVVYNVTEPVGSRVVSVKILCRQCHIPRYKPLRLEEIYRIVLSSFLVNGGDDFLVIANNLMNHKVGNIDNEVLQRYIAKRSPIIQGTEERISIVF